MNVVVASLNRAKIEAVRAVFGRIWPECRVSGVRIAVPERISEMPLGRRIKEGAVYRALASAGEGVDFSVGAEGGVAFAGRHAYLYNWVAIRRWDGELSVAPSAKLRLPPSVGEAIRAGRNLGELMVEKTGRADVNEGDGAVGYYTRGLVSRSAFFEECLACALAPFLHPLEYGIPETVRPEGAALPTAEPVGESKDALRRSARALRRQIPDRAAKSERIARHLAEAPFLSAARTVMAYVAIRDEVDLTAWVDHCRRHGIRVAFPVCTDGRTLIPRVAHASTPLIPNRFGVPEPAPGAPELDPAELDAVVVPALMYDRAGYRLGYGGGYYDRFLQLLRPETVKIGVAYEELVRARLPRDPHDIPVDWIVTERGARQAREGR